MIVISVNILKNMNRNLIIILMILLAVITRLLPHPPNVAPITAIALFAAQKFQDKKLAFLLPILCMVLTDAVLGFHSIIPFVYLSIIGISCIGVFSKKINNITIFKSSVVFFVVSNFGVWLLGYPNSLSGFISCYTLALPFLLNTVLGDFFFYYVLNLSFSKIEERYPIIAS
tara:strand:+ start:1019 stop:1534 length:516 start_codon:yes stop_codon:yes gene_type:complete